MKGTARWFEPEVGDRIEAGMHRLVNGIAASFGATAELNFYRHAPATVNDAEATGLARRSGDGGCRARAVWRRWPSPTMGGEDFAFMLEAKQGAYLMLGGGPRADDPQLHHPQYDFNDEILPIGASWWATLVERQLAKKR